MERLPTGSAMARASGRSARWRSRPQSPSVSSSRRRRQDDLRIGSDLGDTEHARWSPPATFRFESRPRSNAVAIRVGVISGMATGVMPFDEFAQRRDGVEAEPCRWSLLRTTTREPPGRRSGRRTPIRHLTDDRMADRHGKSWSRESARSTSGSPLSTGWSCCCPC